MPERIHQYSLNLKWTGNRGAGTSGYSAYSRSHIISKENKAEISASSDPAFHGDRSKYNPEELFLAALSSCHMLWYLHLCAEAEVIVLDYEDRPEGSMKEEADGRGYFQEVILNPVVKVKEATMMEKALQLHDKAGSMCFIANSVNFSVRHHPKIIVD